LLAVDSPIVTVLMDWVIWVQLHNAEAVVWEFWKFETSMLGSRLWIFFSQFILKDSKLTYVLICLHVLGLLNLVLYCFHVLKTVLNHSLICITIAERRSWIHTKMQAGWLHYVAAVPWQTQLHWLLSSSTCHAIMEGNLHYFPSQIFASYSKRCVNFIHLVRY
jgi:hypothetical protein